MLLLFDLTNKNTFKNLPKWLSDFKDNGPEDSVIFIVGNKSDLENEREVTYDEVREKVGYNVALLFESIANKLVKKEKEENGDFNNNVSSNSNLKQPRVYNSQLGKKYKAKVNLTEQQRDEKVGCC